MESKLQIIYMPSREDIDVIHPYYHNEAAAVEAVGIMTGVKPVPNAAKLLYRGFRMSNEADYPKDKRFLQGFEIYTKYLSLTQYYPYILDLSIDTFFVDELESSVIVEIEKRYWQKAFIKKDTCALEHIEKGKSVWPDTSFEEMKKLFDESGIEGKYCIRRFIEKDVIDLEERYWVLNGDIYHRHNNVPDVVKEAANRLNKLGSRYYTIDATPSFVVEVNPGESSDRHAVNSAELFASWIKNAFFP